MGIKLKRRKKMKNERYDVINKKRREKQLAISKQKLCTKDIYR